MEGRTAWDELYRKQPRAWRGTLNLPDIDLPPGSKVLDAGCGNGKTSIRLIEMGFDVTGVDNSEYAVRSCIERLGGQAEFLVSDCMDIPLPDSSVDGIYAVHLTEHLNDDGLMRFSKECKRILRPGGKLFIRSFSPEDMRSDNNIRNGISYRYRTPEDIFPSFTDFVCMSSAVVNEETRFGTVRSRSECVFIKPQ